MTTATTSTISKYWPIAAVVAVLIGVAVWRADGAKMPALRLPWESTASVAVVQPVPAPVPVPAPAPDCVEPMHAKGVPAPAQPVHKARQKPAAVAPVPAPAPVAPAKECMGLICWDK
jgi:hypothetical protein